MYCEYWGLSEPPFENVVNSRFVFYSTNHDEALLRLFYTVKSQKGACLLTGEIGCGKTTISQVFLEGLDKNIYEIAFIKNPKLKGEEILQEILHRLGMEVAKDDKKVDLLHALEDKLQSNAKLGKHTVLIIDEAHLIKDEDTYEELRLLLNFQENNRFLLTLILSGQPELKKFIKKLPQFDQRIVVKYHLEPLSFVEACKYIHYRMRVAGRSDQVFTAEAAKKIYQYSGGIPRKINAICDMSLLTSFSDKIKEINQKVVNKAITEEG